MTTRGSRDGSDDGGASVVLVPMDVPKAADVLANQLRELILSGDFAEGTALPSERELVTQTRMSRTTVREALRILEVQGMLEIRTGRNGGAFVRQPDERSIAKSVELLIRGRHLRLAALLETREAIEPACAELAAKYRREADLEALEAANRTVQARGPLEDFLSANVTWHMAVASASHNELLTGFMRALSRAIYAATDDQEFLDDATRQETAIAHQKVTEAIRAGDPEAAARRMKQHVSAYASRALGDSARKSTTMSPRGQQN